MIRRVAAGGFSFAIEDEQASSPGALPALVLLHGFTGSEQSWNELRPAMRRLTRTISLDLPGHGATSVDDEALRGRTPAELFSMENVSASVIEVLGRLEIGRYALLGYSMGGRLAIHIALSRPRGLVALIVESASPGLPDSEARRRRIADDEHLAERIEREGLARFVKYWEELPLFASLKRLPAPRRECLRRQRLSCSSAGLAASLRGMGTGAQPWLGDRLGELSIPVLVAAGSEDGKFRAIARQMMRVLHSGSLALIPGCGHVPHLERPELFSDIVSRFIVDRFGPPGPSA